MERNYRNCKIDNIKALLMFLVVFGHLLELVPGAKSLWLYSMIYTFHMPVFVYFTGYFAKPDSRRRFFETMYTYIIYQILYILFQRYILHQDAAFQFMYPYWVLWYLISLVVWLLLCPLLDERLSDGKTGKRAGSAYQKRMLFLSAALALLAGFDSGINYYLSLSRTLCLLPFFVMGYYRIVDFSSDNPLSASLNDLPREGMRRKALPAAGLALAFLWIGISAYILWKNIGIIEPRWFYHAYPYDNTNTILIRAGILASGFIWIPVLKLFVTGRKLLFISGIGRYTMPVFLLHGFLVKWMEVHPIIWKSEIRGIRGSVFLAAAICMLLGNPFLFRIIGITISPGRIWARRTIPTESSCRPDKKAVKY